MFLAVLRANVTRAPRVICNSRCQRCQKMRCVARAHFRNHEPVAFNRGSGFRVFTSSPKDEKTQQTDVLGRWLLNAAVMACVMCSFTQGKDVSDELNYPIVFSREEGLPWVQSCVSQYREISWLAESDVRKIEEGQELLEGTYSESLFGKKYIEFDRTLMTLHCLRNILKGGNEAYEMFTSEQPKSVKLSRESFDNMHLWGKSLLESRWEGLSKRQMAMVMETALVLGDMGKSETARVLFAPYGVRASDHDDFYAEAMQVLKDQPQLCPSFDKLPLEGKRLLINIATKMHYSHITHLKGGLSMFTPMKDKKLSKGGLPLEFDLFIHACDVAGSLGHINNQTSMVYTQNTHLAMESMREAIKMFLRLGNSEPDAAKRSLRAYNAYLKERASFLALNDSNKFDRVLTRIGAMLHLFTPNDGMILKKTMNKLSIDIQKKIVKYLDVTQEDSLTLPTPTYMTAVLVSLFDNPKLGLSRDQRLSEAIRIGLPLIADILEKHQFMVSRGQISADIPLCFDQIADVAKQYPQLLDAPVSIDMEGNVFLISNNFPVVSSR